jgi:hypothetical protein
MEKRNTHTSTLLLAGILVILVVTAAVVIVMVWQSLQLAQQAILPVNQVASSLGTQVAQVLHPTPTILPDPVTIIHSVRSLARLETIQYTVEKVITAESGQGTFGFLFGDRLLLVAHGVVIAGLDLGKLGVQDLSLENNVLKVRLPAAEVFIATLDNEKTYIYNRETGILTKGNINLETAARQAAENEIKQAALEDGILDQARQNGESFLTRLFLQLGYPEVIFIDSEAGGGN